MDILKSNEEFKTCIGGALIFSGRPDPLWNVERGIVRKLKKIWRLLGPWIGELPSALPLGYRGCFLRCKPDIEWVAYGGVVTLKTAEGYESRIDKDKSFERLLLSSAPKGLLPVEKIL